MKAFFEIEQRSYEWHEMRYGKIGGSLAKGLHVKSDTLILDLLSCRLEPFEVDEDPYESDAMERGNSMEPMARKALSEYIGVELLECGWLQCELNSLIGISPDGVSEDLTVAAEIKCPSRKKHTEYIVDGNIPSEYISQCIHYFTVNPKLEVLYFASFRPECMVPLFVKSLRRENMINCGTKSKPVMGTVQYFTEKSRAEADRISKEIEEKIINLQQI